MEEYNKYSKYNTIKDLPNDVERGSCLFVQTEKRFFFYDGDGVWIPMLNNQRDATRYNRDVSLNKLLDEDDENI